MSQTLKWKFAENQSGDVLGPNDPGISYFAGSPATAIIREAIQNSLDAREGESPVLVCFERKTLDNNIMAAEGLLQHIEWSINSPDNDDDNMSVFKNARGLLRGGGGDLSPYA